MDATLIPVIAVSIPIVVLPALLIFKYHTRKRELEHIERMKALELGRVHPNDEPWWNPAKLTGLIGAAVPLGALVLAFIASESTGFREEIWMACGTVGAFGVVCASFLVARSQFRPSTDRLTSKSAYDPDALDVVGRRG